ncbi:Rieske (2Fe-2S) protein [Neptuniibacter sp.]|uniref:Rieske (2Fe-2S) protein n=1 Tax=Neptuniibacter sp. TaxID=1962643 RepID=UPI003B5CEC40
MRELCDVSDFQELQTKGFEFEGKGLLLVKHREQFYLYENNCPHRSIPLEWQPDQFLDYEKTFIQCATHGALFKIETGECISGPCVADSLTPVAFEQNGSTILIDI